MKKIWISLAFLAMTMGIEAKSLVAYFSATGTTRAAAQRLAAQRNAFLWEIEPAEPYTEADLNWRDSQSRSSREMNDPEERPTIKQCTSIMTYDTIYLGYPIWWGICPRIINSWLDNNEPQLASKIIIPFATSGSSGIEKSEQYLRQTYPTLNWRKGSLIKPNAYLSLAEKIAKSEMAHHPQLWTCDGASKPKWEYTPTFLARAFVELYQNTGNTTYLDHAQQLADQFVGEDGTILTYKMSLYNMDRVQGGNFLILLNQLRSKPEYLIAIETLRDQLRNQPRTTEGGFWHKQVYPHQMWLDGLFTGTTFYARYAAWKPEPQAWSDIVNQFMVVDRHTRKSNGLNHHGWDESRQMGWSDALTGCSPETWGRAEGWYVMALCDVLELMPEQHPQRNELVAILNRVMQALLEVQDPKTHLWYQVPDRPAEEGNYLESTCAAMYCYAMAKGARLGVLPESFRKEAESVMDGLQTYKLQTEEDGTLSLIDCCAVAGLGGNPYRDGTYQYYVHERINRNDPKGIAPLILACLELAK